MVASPLATEGQKSLHSDNTEAYDQILMGCSGIPLGLVKRAKGKARLAIETLDEKYAGAEDTDLTTLLNEFNGCKLEGTTTDPVEWFVKLDSINEKLGNIEEQYQKKDYEMKAHLLGNLPAEYSDVKTKISGKEKEYTVTAIEKEIRNKWKRDFKVDGKNEKDQKALMASSGKSKRKFKGRCRKCGIQGHKASECKSDKKGVCYHCGEDGHFARDCPKKDNSNPGTNLGMFVGMAIMQQCFEISGNDETFLIDSGATCHISKSDEGMTDIVQKKEMVLVGDKRRVYSERQGTLKLKTEDGKTIVLKNTLILPEMASNLVSLGLLLEAGNEAEFKQGHMKLTSPSGNEVNIPKDEKSPMFRLKATRESDGQSAMNTTKEAAAEMDINDAHELYGHLSMGPLQKLLKERGVKVVGTKRTCEACAYAKAKAKAVCKTTSVQATQKGERLFVDLSGPYSRSLIGSQYWALIVDDWTRKAWSFFIKKKSDLKKVVNRLLTTLKGAGIVVKYLRCDNAGENVKGLKEICEVNGIVLELTAPNTPQQNGVVERRFVTCRDRSQAMMLGASLDEKHQGLLWCESTATATRLSNIVPNSVRPKPPDELWYESVPKLHGSLIRWGQIGYVTIRSKKVPKLAAKSVKCVCVGYAEDHASDCYRMFNPETGKVSISRDVTWVEWHGSQEVPESLRMFAKDMEVDCKDDQIEDTVIAAPSTPHVIPDYDEDGIKAGRKGEGVTDADGRSITLLPSAESSGSAKSKSTTRAERERARLHTYYNPTMERVSDDEDESGEQSGNVEVHYVFNAELASDPGEPKTFWEALESKDREKWIKAIQKEIENFLKRKVWKKVSIDKLKKGQRPIKVKWIFKKKNEQDGSIRYKGRIVVRGFVQIPGVDFTHTHSPIEGDVSIKLVLALALFMGWMCEMIDIEAAFLEADLEEDVYIEWPEGLVKFGYISEEETKSTCIKLEKAMYGCVQSPRAFFKELAKKLTEMEMEQCKAEPCIWYYGEVPELVVACYVDDLIIVGTQEKVDWFKKKIKERFRISELGRITKHLGVWYDHVEKGTSGERYELKMDAYKEDIVNDWKRITGREVKPANTPGFPGKSLVKNEGESLDKDGYRKVLGKLMWFTKKLLPECANPIRELAMYMDNPGKEHWRALDRMIGYLQGVKGVLNMRKPKSLKVEAFVDSNFATNKESRKSVTGYVLTIGGCIVGWSSKTQPSVTLSSTEAEYVAASMCATEIKYIQMVLEEIAPNQVTRPATLFEDNTGAISLKENKSVGSRTKHIDTRWHFIREMLQQRLVVRFVRSEDNVADLETKNQPEALMQKHRDRICEGNLTGWRSASDREDVGNMGSDEVQKGGPRAMNVVCLDASDVLCRTDEGDMAHVWKE